MLGHEAVGTVVGVGRAAKVIKVGQTVGVGWTAQSCMQCRKWAMQALKRIGHASDVAEVIAFLASDGARWITGASIPVDGGSKL